MVIYNTICLFLIFVHTLTKYFNKVIKQIRVQTTLKELWDIKGMAINNNLFKTIFIYY
jgi:hypothetical protein